VRIGTWNLNLRPETTTRAEAIASWLDLQRADIWLLTEIQRDWDPRGRSFVVSPSRALPPDEKRWAAIETSLPLGELRSASASGHPGEESLCLARVQLGGGPSSALVACSVLPWKGAGEYWSGLPTGQFDQFKEVLDHHVARIAEERFEGEPLIWGGDFNQQLVRPFSGATLKGAVALREAFQAFGLAPLTEHAAHLDGSLFAIDHLAVSREFLPVESGVTVHRPEWDSGQLSDHAAYTAEVGVALQSAGGAAANTRHRCRRCGQRGALPVVYGLVTSDPDGPVDGVDVINAGCMVSSDAPRFLCVPCGRHVGLL
jgi:hypothetical protein